MESQRFLKANELSAVSLAFVGDAVFSLYIRERLAMNHDFKSGVLSKMSNMYVNAKAQSKMYEAILPELTDEEQSVLKRGRNAHTNNKAKNAALSDYKRATALETLFGFLYLSEQKDRLIELEEICFNKITL